jgi:hypothetical protein
MASFEVCTVYFCFRGNPGIASMTLISGNRFQEFLDMTQENLAAGSLPTPAFLRLFDDDHVSDNNLAFSRPPAPGQCITILRPESDDVSDANLNAALPQPPSFCVRRGKDELSVQFDDLDLSAPPPGFHTQSCSCGLGCRAPVADKSEFSDSDLTLSAPIPGGPKPCYSACGVW